jgi:hypothetical protein
LVNIIEDWEVLEEYAGEKLGFYQLLDSDGLFEIRVLTGRCSFKREFENWVSYGVNYGAIEKDKRKKGFAGDIST